MQRDREGIRKMERLVLQKSYLFNPSHRRYRSSVSPLFSATPRNTTGHGRGEEQTQYTGKY